MNPVAARSISLCSTAPQTTVFGIRGHGRAHWYAYSGPTSFKTPRRISPSS